MNERFYTTHAPPVKMQGALETIALLPVHAQGGLRLILKPGADAGFYLLPVHAQVQRAAGGRFRGLLWPRPPHLKEIIE